MSNKRQIRNSVAFSAVSALMISGVAVNPASAEEIQVTNCLDSGAGSLRDAVENASSGAVVLLEELGCDTITLDSYIEISTSVSIVGPGASNLSITNDSTNNNGLFVVENEQVLFLSVEISKVTLTTHSDLYDIAEPLILSDGASAVSLNFVELTDVRPHLIPAIAVAGPLRIAQSSFHSNRIDSAPLVLGLDIHIQNSSFVGNTVFEGTLLAGPKAGVINSAFVDNFPEAADAQSGATLFGVLELTSYATIFADEFVTSEEHFQFSEYSDYGDLGSNYYAFDESVIGVWGITNTTVGNGASTLVSREDLKLGAFDRVSDATYGLSPRHQQLAAGSVAIDSHTLAQFEVADSLLVEDFQTSMIPFFDAAGERRPFGPKYDSGPIEFVVSSGLTSRSKNVFFNPMSATLTKEARQALRKMVNNLPEGATVRRINIMGFVQPAGFSWNNKSLSDARARNVKRFLKTLDVKGQWKIAARGEDKDSTSKARRVKVVVKYDVVPPPPR